MDTKREPTSDDQFDDFATAKTKPFTTEELERLARSRQKKDVTVIKPCPPLPPQ